ncbi:hypothetical protein ABUJ16_22810, partial [Salmonella enterica subsp. enterica serovar Vom]|uniref:hypothetical protein n=1 Tax=Salmonella enterica TaxID=28901 RepID=UPI003315942F
RAIIPPGLPCPNFPFPTTNGQDHLARLSPSLSLISFPDSQKQTFYSLIFLYFNNTVFASL